MAKPASKRLRKQRNKVDLKSKGRASADALADVDVEGILAPELRKDNVPQQVIITDKARARANKQAAQAASAQAAKEATLTKAEQRKLAQIEKKKQSQARLTEAFSSLNETQLDDRTRSVLLSSSSRGGKQSLKQRLRRDKILSDAGVPLTNDSRLYSTHHPGPSAGHNDSDSDEAQLDPLSGSHSRDRSSPPSVTVLRESKSSTKREGQRAGAGASTSDSSDDDDAPAPPKDLSQRQPPLVVTFGAGRKRPRSEAAAEVEAAAAQRAAEGAAAHAARMRASKAALDELIASGEVPTARDVEAPAQRPRSVPPLGPVRSRPVTRPPSVSSAREGLPIVGMEAEIMSCIDEHDVILLCGETGCGKTTQVPQFLFEAGFGCKVYPERGGLIGVTQPRRVAAVSTATRVAEELSSRLGGVVGYQVRYDKSVGSDTAIKFMTDGILMRELQEDFLLSRYSVLVLDEAHERSLNTDLLIGMLTRIVPQRRKQAETPGATITPLKVIIMSATLCIDDFANNDKLFPRTLYPHGPPPIINVPARQFPVLVHYSKRTELDDYIGAAYRKVARIHRELPAGGILVFVTGQREVQQLQARLQRMFPGAHRAGKADHPHTHKGKAPRDAYKLGGLREGEYDPDDSTVMDVDGADRAEVDAHLIDAHKAPDAGDASEDEFEDPQDDMEASDSEEEGEVQQLGGAEMTPDELAAAERFFEDRYGLSVAAPSSTAAARGPRDARVAGEAERGDSAAARPELQRSAQTPVQVLPLYAMLHPDEQARVFAAPAPGHRQIVIATNVAETSLTIPGIRYVVDAGRSKQKLLEPASGLHRFQVRWISKASADQRAGRAGRTGPGHCYRLFSSAAFNDLFPQFSPPEIINTALEGVVLSMRALGLPKVLNFPFPTPPDEMALRQAERCLVAISALTVSATAASAKTATSSQLELTPLGRAMAAFPISPRHSRMLLEAASLAAQKVCSAVDLLPHAVALAAVLSAESPFMHPDTTVSAGDGDDDHDSAQKRKEQAAARDAVRAAHNRLRNNESDALSALNAMLAYEAAQLDGDGATFCRDHHLHAVNLRESSALRTQLMRILRLPSALALAAKSGHEGAALLAKRFASSKAAAEDAASSLQRPSGVLGDVLRRCVTAGWCDQVACRLRSRQHVLSTAEGRGSRAVRYQACGLDENVYLHPRSNLARTAPDFAVYVSLVQTEKRPYMSMVSAADAAWLPDAGPAMTTLSDPLVEPAPFYSAQRDCVLAWRQPSYGSHGWQLPLYACLHPERGERCGHFAKALLEGKVAAPLGHLAPAYNCKPQAFATREGRALQRVSDVVAALQRRQCDNAASLNACWSHDGQYLKAEIRALLQSGHRNRLDSLWPAVVASIGDSSRARKSKAHTQQHVSRKKRHKSGV